MAEKENIPAQRKFQDLVGKVFGKLTVQSFYGRWKGRLAWTCQCACGSTSPHVWSSCLTSGNTKSCGCEKRNAGKQTKTHGMSDAVEYGIWFGMKKRCENEKCSNFANYGGRGIKVCDRWRSSFSNFYEDMGQRPSPKHSIDRIDNDGDYCKENCKWSTRTEQSQNRRNNVVLLFNGESKLMAEWERSLGLSKGRLCWRLKNGWTVEEALSSPARPIHRQPITNAKVNDSSIPPTQSHVL